MLTGNLLTPEGWRHGTIEFGNGRITSLSGRPVDPSRNDDPYILPGFIDLHVHGGGGADVMEGGDAIETIARTHARFGTTSLLATTMTAPRDELMNVVSQLGERARHRTPGGARVLGVHLEGPYINPGKLGAQPDAAVSAVLDEVLKYLSIAPIRVVTLAPEIAGHIEIIGEMAARGVRVQLGHSLATYEDGVAALKHGACGFTHLFNAMSPLHHRNPGLVGAALAHAEYAEIIPDLLHVHPGAIRAALRSIPRLYVRDRQHLGHRHARRRIPARQPARDQVPGRRAPGRRHAGRQHPDHGPGAAQPGLDRPADRRRVEAPVALRGRLPRHRRPRPPRARRLGRCRGVRPRPEPHRDLSSKENRLSNMLEEARQASQVVAAQLADLSRVEALAERLLATPPHVALTVARGSSDHAASYFASLTMSRLGVPVASLPMSVATLQQAPLRVRDQLAIAFSQSGKSPDLVNTMAALREAGALTVAAVNVLPSPLADACEHALPLRAGPELSVAATKSYIAMLSLSAQLVALWQRDAALMTGLRALPDALAKAGTLDWSPGHRRAARGRADDRDRPRRWASRSPRKPRSSSRKPRASRPRPSRAPRSATARWS